MRKWTWFSILVTITLLFSACAEDDDVQNPPANNEGSNTTETNNNAQTNSNATEEAPYIFVDFDLDADFDGIDDTIEVEYEYEMNDIEASYKNRVQDINLSGDEALRYLDTIFSSLTFDENTPEGEVLDIIIEAFDLPYDAVIDLEIEFKNGPERQYSQM